VNEGAREKEGHRLMKHPWKTVRVLIIALAIALVAAACGNDNGGASAGEGGEELSGSITISGSSTVEPITVAVAEKFRAAQPNVEVSVTGPGTSDGFEVFCNGETEISDASRAIDEEEIAKCEQNGIEFIELKVGIDGLSMITSAENDFSECMNFADIWALLGPEAEGFEQWSDANQLGEQVGASGVPYPDEPLVITAPGEESGTFGSFIELTLEVFVEDEGIKKYEEEVSPRPDYQASGNDNVIVEGIAGNDSSLGWVGYAFYVANQDRVKALQVDRGDGCVAPTPETIASFEYPISRPLFIYVNQAKMQETPAVEAFVDFYLSDEGIVSAEEVGYVPLDESDLSATREAWEAKETGTREG
jgi:phosphate transport system substrate-binding protein